jgi:hypothetical protein
MESKDILTPTAIKKWANNTSDAELPTQLMELETVVENSELLFTLASDQHCPRRAYILNCMYSLIGQSISTHDNSDISLIKTFLDKAAQRQDAVILNLVARSKIIMRDLRKYDYVEWCGGGFVRKDLAY